MSQRMAPLCTGANLSWLWGSGFQPATGLQRGSGARGTDVSKLKIETLDDLKEAIKAHRQRGKNLLSNLNRIEQEYSDWEDRTIEIEKAIVQAEEDIGISKEEIEKETNITEEIFGDSLNG